MFLDYWEEKQLGNKQMQVSCKTSTEMMFKLTHTNLTQVKGQTKIIQTIK